MPRPKEYRETGDPLLLAPAGRPVLVHAYGEHTALLTAQRDLTARLKSLGGTVVTGKEGAVIRVGVASEWPSPASPLQPAVPDKPQGYALWASANESRTAAEISIRGTDPMGAYFGVQTLIQLLERSDEGITVRQARVRDWPTFTFRMFKGQCWYYRDNRMFVEWAPRFKWNVFGSCYTDCPDWREPPAGYRRMIGDLCDAARRTGTIGVLQLGNPYMLKEKAIRATSAGDVETLAAFFELSLARGSDVLMLCLDDFAYLPEKDSERFSSLAEANISIVNRFAARIWSGHPGTRILLCPPPYWLTANKARGYEWAHQYLRELSAGIPRQITIVWTGGQVTTVRHEAADVQAYQALLGPARHLFLWDNTLKMPPGWGNVFRMNPFLAACNDIAGSAWPKMASFTRGQAGINTYGPAEIYKVPLMTAADYLWSPERYQPADALRRALYWFDENPRVGPLVHRWTNHLHQQLYTKRLAFLKKPSQPGLDKLRALTGEYQALFDRIAAETKNEMLVATLKPYLRRHTEAIEILGEVFAAYEKIRTDPAEARRKLDQAAAALTELTDVLGKGDLAADRHGCVRQVLEEQSLKAVKALRPQ